MPLSKIKQDSVDSSEVLALSGIKFPATQSASSDANTLDDYEEGTFSVNPTPTSGSFTTVSSVGNYVKIGKQVTVYVTLFISNIGTGSGLINFALPFTATGSAFSPGSAMESNAAGLTGIAYVANNVGTIRKYDWSGTVIGTNYSWQTTVTYYI